jgi:hypothetical protein
MLLIDGQYHGPYTIGQMRHALKTGAVTSDIKAQCPGMPGWNPLKKWPEFKGMGAEKQSLGESVQMSSRNPHAIDCFGSGLIMVVLFLALFTTGYSTVNPIMDPKISIVLTWVLFIGWLFGRALLIKDSANLGEGFGSLDLFEMAFKVYFNIMVILAARGLIMVIFALVKGGETFLLTMML